MPQTVVTWQGPGWYAARRAENGKMIEILPVDAPLGAFAIAEKIATERGMGKAWWCNCQALAEMTYRYQGDQKTGWMTPEHLLGLPVQA